MKRAPIVLRWDLDKTYLVSQFESLRYLIRVPFQKAKDKVAVPGVATLIKGVRRTIERKKHDVSVYFLSASPPQIGNAIREKLDLDGIEYEGITFKDQVRHLMYARFDAVLEQIGYKLERLLSSAAEMEEGAVELLFGDDWESDPFVYSLYADLLDAHVGQEALDAWLRRAGVSRHYSERIAELAVGERRQGRVQAIFILRQRPARGPELDEFGPRLVWFDNYFECALRLWELGCLDVDGVFDVVADLGFNPAQTAASFDAMCDHGGVERARLGPVRRQLVAAGVMQPVAPGSLASRASAAFRRPFASRLGKRSRPFLPNYTRLVDRWSYRGRKERSHEAETADSRADDGRQ